MWSTDANLRSSLPDLPTKWVDSLSLEQGLIFLGHFCVISITSHYTETKLEYLVLVETWDVLDMRLSDRCIKETSSVTVTVCLVYWGATSNLGLMIFSSPPLAVSPPSICSQTENTGSFRYSMGEFSSTTTAFIFVLQMLWIICQYSDCFQLFETSTVGAGLYCMFQVDPSVFITNWHHQILSIIQDLTSTQRLTNDQSLVSRDVLFIRMEDIYRIVSKEPDVDFYCLYSVQYFIFYTCMFYTLCSILYVLKCMFYTLCSKHCSKLYVLYSMFSVLYVLCILCSKLYALNSVIYSMFYILYSTVEVGSLLIFKPLHKCIFNKL